MTTGGGGWAWQRLAGPLRRCLIAALFSLCLDGCSHPIAAAAGRGGTPSPRLVLDYSITYSRQPHRLSVEVRLDGPPRDFLFTQPGAVDAVVVAVNGTHRTLAVADDGAVPLPKGTTSLRYDYVMGDHLRGSPGGLYMGAGSPGSLLIAARAYLIRPRVAEDVRVHLQIAGAQALLPWRPEADGTWRLSGVQLVDGGFHSFGGRRCSVEVDKAQLEVALHEGERIVDDGQVCAWIRTSAEEVLTVRKRFPYRRVTVHTIPGPGAEPSPLGLMLWSDPPSLAVVIGRQATPSAFTTDWVAVHELLHLAHPSFMGEAPWLSEGLATYYTEVARMRAGRLSTQVAWQNLMEGFERGRQQADGRTLQGAVEALAEGIYLPVYWAGALIALELDVGIREATGNARSLDDVLETLATVGQTSSVEAFGRAVDVVAGRPVFEAILERRRRGEALSAADEVLRRLGVFRGEGGALVLDPKAPNAHIREAISTAPERGVD